MKIEKEKTKLLSEKIKVGQKKKKMKHLKPQIASKATKVKHLKAQIQQEVVEPELKKYKPKREKQEDEEEEKDQELSPEQKRTLERKLKKERNKLQKKLMREAGIVPKKEEPKKPSSSELALEYLTTWFKNPKEWKFQKTRQTWLLLNMYEEDKVPDNYFSIMLQYLEGLKGSARDITVQKAEALMKKYDSSEMEDGHLLEKCERIRKVLQLLS